jgi:hypothetical protein
MGAMRFFSAFVLCLSLAACGTTRSVTSSTGEIRSQRSVELTQNVELSAETLGVAGTVAVFGHPENAFGLSGQVFSPANAALLYIIYDPLAPNWNIEEKALNEDTYYLSLRAKSFRTGGDGEAIRIIQRRALQLQREKGYTGYQILDYSEGIESSTPLTHRYSEGTIQLVKTQLPPKR